LVIRECSAPSLENALDAKVCFVKWTTTTDIEVAKAARDNKCLVELRINGHVVSVTDIQEQPDGTYDITILDDPAQAPNSKPEQGRVTYDPAIDRLYGRPGFNNRHLSLFVIECPP
jgi:hypothetical protein